MKSRILILLTLALSGCALRPGVDAPPLQVHPDMDHQLKFKAQSASTFFADGRSNRMPVPGTIAHGALKEDDGMFTGKDSAGNLIKTSPIAITEAVMKRGQERFNINCSPCHGRMAEGNGIVKTRSFGALNPANLTQQRIREAQDGYIFDVITNGIRTMQPLAAQITPQDRWAIVAYVRALQRSQTGTMKDVPAGTTVKDPDPNAAPPAPAAASTPAGASASPAVSAAPADAKASKPAKK